jgi:hypothetical protein
MISFNQRESIKAALIRSYKERFCDVQKMMVPTAGVMMFLPYCIGSRAECRSVGMRGTLAYVDLKSAFVSALLMIPDYDFHTCYMTTGTACNVRMEAMLEFGAFQLAGIELSWVFKSDVDPTLPLKVAGRRYNNQKTEALIFPTSGKGPVTWTEFYAAYTAGLFESFIIHSIVEFEPLKTYHLAGRIKDLLVMRHDDAEGVIKGILTHFYGKTLSGLGNLKDNHFDVSGLSGISCFPLAGFMTGVCRAIIGEIIQSNLWHAIASDAVILDGSGPVRVGPLAETIQRKMDPLGYQFVETEFCGDQGLFLKSRGYLLFGHSVNDGVLAEKASLKLANMGMKTDRVRDEFDPAQLGAQQVNDFMTGLITGKLRCYNFQSFSHLENEYKNNKEQTKELQRELKNNRNMQSRLRKAAGISSTILKIRYNKLACSQPYKDYEKEQISAYIAGGGVKAEALTKVLSEYADLRRQYAEVSAYEIFPRRYFYTVGVNHTFDFKRVPIMESIEPETVEFDYGASDGSNSTHYKFRHVSFTTRPLYSANEYQQLIQAATYRMDHNEYIKMLEDLEGAGVLSHYHKHSEKQGDDTGCTCKLEQYGGFLCL